MNNQDKWTNEVLNSLEGIQKAVPNDSLLDRVMAQLPKNNQMPQRQLRWIAVAAGLLIGLNIYMFSFDEQTSSNASASEYVSLVEDYSLYQ